MIFRRFSERFRKRDVEVIIEEVNKKDICKRYLWLIFGCFISAFAFNVFFLQFRIVCFGVSGISIVLNEFGVNPSNFIFVANIVLLIISFYLLGIEKTKNSIVGSLLFPLFVKLTEYIVPYIRLDRVELIVIVIFGAVISGIGYGLIFKTGFTTGGTDIVNQIIAKYTKTSIGKAMLIVDGLVVLSGKLVFSWETVMYGFIVLYIISALADKVILGISQSKAFYIITEKEDEAREFLLSIVNGGVTVITVRGGYTNDKQVMLLGVVPTRSYFLVKEGLREIDKDVFFLVCDAYEVCKKTKGENKKEFNDKNAEFVLEDKEEYENI